MVDKVLDIIEMIFENMFGWIVAPFANLKSIYHHVFGLGPLGGDQTDLAYGIFTLDEINDIYVPGMNVFVALAVSGILIGIIFGGMKIASSGINPANRTFVFAFMKDLAIVAILLFNLSAIYSLVFGVNYTIVGVFEASADSFFDLPTTWDELMELNDTASSNGVIGLLLIGLVLLGLTIWATFYYTMRKITLLMFMIAGPLMIAFFLIPQTKQITMAWMKEFIGTVMVQSVHASLFWMISLITTSGESDFITNTILYIIFIPTAEGLRSLIGLGGGMTSTMSKTGAMMGLGALAGVYGAAKGAFKDQSVGGALKGAYDGAKGKGGSGGGEGGDSDPDVKNTLGANTGTDTGTTARSERMLKPGEITSKMGKAVLGSAGSIAGSAMGPGGAIIGSTLGFGAGGVIGGVAGRAGAASIQGISALAKKSGSNFKDGFNSTVNSTGLADEKLADSIADSETVKWGADNKEDFMKKNREAFPDADDESLNNMWNQEYSNKKSENLAKAKGYVGEIRKNDGKYANAQTLANETATGLTNNWEKDNKDQFLKDYDQKNPLPVNANSDDRKAHDEKKQQAWSNRVNEKSNQFSQLANNTAKDMSNGIDTDKAYVSKEDFAKNVGNQAHEMDKDAFVKDYRSKYNSGASREEIEAIYDKEKGGNKQLYMGAVNSVMAGQSNPNAKQLSGQSAEQLTENWSNENRAGFERNYKSQNPNSSKEDVDVAWNKEVSGKKQEFLQATNSVANQMSSAQGKDPQQATISKNAFADQVATKLDANDKKQFVTDYQKNALKGDDGIRQEYDQQNKPIRESYLAQAQNATQGVKSGKLVNNFGKSANMDYLTSQVATVKTAEAKKNYETQQTAKGHNPIDIETGWKQKEGQEYSKNHSDIKSHMPKAVEMPSRALPNKVLGNSPIGRGVEVGSKAILGTAIGGYGATVGVVGDGVKKTGNIIKDTRVGAAIQGIAPGAHNAYTEAQTTNSSFIKATGKGLKGGATGMVNGFKEHTVDNAVGKQQAVTKGLAFAGGIVAGTTGYKKMSQVGSKFNPYNNAVQQETKEVSDIEQMAQKTTENGNKVIAPGAVQMVTTKDQSYIQVKDHAGQTRIVSRYGSGDSGLQKDHKVYQDMNIENGQMKQASEPYRYDTGGNAVPTNRSINVNPNRLVANRNQGKTQPVVHEAPALNQDVDYGSFDTEQVVNKTQNVRMVVTRDTSYMVATDKSSGKDMRVSQYGQGDARLEQTEVRQSKYTVKNNRWVKQDRVTVNEQNKEVDYNSSANPNDLIPPKENKRAQKRRKMEAMRHKGFGGTV